MEPSVIKIPINNEIKFKKSDLESLKNSAHTGYKSVVCRVCSISNVKYHFSIFPNGGDEDHGQTQLYLEVELGNATTVDVDVECSITSAKKGFKVQHVYEEREGWGGQLGAASDFFEDKRKFFVDDLMTVKIKGIFTVKFPTKIPFPIYAEWSLKQSDSEVVRSSVKRNLKSKEFKISPNSNIKYFLKIYPNGDEEENRGTAWIFFHLKLGNTVPKVETVYSISVESANYSYDFEYVFEKDKGYGINICTTEDLFNPEKRYFVDGELTIKVTGALMMEKKKAKRKTVNAAEVIVNPMVQSHGGKNFTIIVKDEHIRVHKHVLEAASPYFVGMFNSGMTESIKKETAITDFSYDIVAAGIKLIYNPTEFPTHFNFEQMLDLLQFSDKYDIQVIKDRAQDYLIENLSPTNVCPLITFTTTTVLSATKLLTKCQEYLVKCSKTSKAVNGLEILDKDLLLKILLGTFAQSL